MIMKALNEPPRDRKKEKNILHNGNISLEDVYETARALRFKSMAAKFAGTVKEVLGTCRAVGCTVDGMTPKEVTEKINSGEIVTPNE